MLMLSITPMDMEHIDEICEDLRLQQEQGISDCAMLTAHFEAEGTPPVSKGAIYGKLYRKFREKLEPMGVRSGVLVQSTLGHIYPPNVEHPFQKVVSLVSGTKYDVCKPYNDAQLKGNEFQPMCCPYDKAFQAYMKDQMRILAQEKPSVIMVDDDMGLLYRIGIKGCCCPLHMAEFTFFCSEMTDCSRSYCVYAWESHLCSALTQMQFAVQKFASRSLVCTANPSPRP